MEKEKLEEIVAIHGRWIQDKGGKRACLRGVDLSHADLRGANLREAELEGVNLSHADLCYADLRGANLRHAELCHADLYGADLSHANLCHADMCHANLSYADLRCVDLCHADLRGANLCQANLCGAKLPTGMYQVVGAGSCNRCTTYDVINDQIVCGCWNDGKGNHLDSFIKRIEMVYGPKGEESNSVYYTEYMSAIIFFRAMKELNKKS